VRREREKKKTRRRDLSTIEKESKTKKGSGFATIAIEKKPPGDLYRSRQWEDPDKKLPQLSQKGAGEKKRKETPKISIAEGCRGKNSCFANTNPRVRRAMQSMRAKLEKDGGRRVQEEGLYRKRG